MWVFWELMRTLNPSLMTPCFSCQIWRNVWSDQEIYIQIVIKIIASQRLWPSWPMKILWGGTCLHSPLSILIAVVLGIFIKYRGVPIVKANNWTLSYILLISLILCIFCSLLFIGHQNTATCIVQQITFGVVFIKTVSTFLSKTITVVLAFKVTTPGWKMRQWLLSGAYNSIIPICLLTQVTFCAVWSGILPLLT